MSAFAVARWMRALAVGSLLAASPVLQAQAPAWPGTEWARVQDPQSAGWSRQKLDEAEAWTRASLKSDAWLLVHRGRVVREYGRVDRVSSVASVRKSVMSILIGMQVDQGRISLDRTLAELGIDDKQALTEVEKTATLRQLIQGRSGIYHPAANEPLSMKKGRPARGSFKPGENFNYNNWDFNAAGTIYRQLAGRRVLEALRDDLAGPLQFQDYEFATGGHDALEASSVHAASVMRLSARDMARVGLLMARGGEWKGRQLVSRRWVDESTTAHSQFRAGNGYGYMWWVGFSRQYAQRLDFPGKVFLAAGYLGQYIVVDPVRDIVFVHKVDFEREPGREVTSEQFAELLVKVMGALERP